LPFPFCVWLGPVPPLGWSVHRRGGYLLSRRLKELEARLDPFLRIPGSAIVQTSHIREVQPQGSSRYRVGLDDGTTVGLTTPEPAGNIESSY
jgi:DNA-binding LytR/AlgR family response regulator